jgi:hypothetical protein
VKRNDRLATILGRRGSHDDVRAPVVEFQVAPNKSPQLAQANPRVGCGEIEQALLVSDSNEPRELFICMGNV